MTTLPLLDRRAVLTGTAALTMGAAAPTLRAAALSPGKSVSALAPAPRGRDGILDRLPGVDLESRQDLMRGFRKWTHDDLMEAAGARAMQLLKANGINPDAPAELDRVIPLFENDPIIQVWARAWISGQDYTFRTLAQEFHTNSEHYLQELEAADVSGPGSLQLDRALVLPDYCRREFHGQPGGYCGDPFAGYIYHYYSLMLNDGADAQDASYHDLASVVATPADGKVRRILDIGTGVGQYATALKQRFPQAEVWAIDSAGPMVRYAHRRAVEMNSEVHFAQRLAEKSGFPSGHFDLVVSNLLHHEVTVEASRAIFVELHRILRPGGVYEPRDLYTSIPAHKPGEGFGGWLRFRLYVNHRWVYEPYLMEWYEMPYRDVMRGLGFEVADTGKVPPPRKGNNVMATKK